MADATLGASNGGLRQPEVMMCEIFFDPISDDDRDEWLELHNPGAVPVDVGGWKFLPLSLGCTLAVGSGPDGARARR